MDAALLAEMNAERRARRAVVLVTDVAAGTARLVRLGDDLASDPFGEEIGRRLRSGQSGLATLADGSSAFLTVHLPPPRLVVCGAVHISQALAPMAKIAGLDVVIVDPRTAFASPERFPGVELLASWPQDVMEQLAFDPWTGLAALTHDPKIDDLAIIAALAAGCFYVGALGSRKTHGKRVERLLAAGVEEAALGRIHAPIGLPIGAASPAEIAVAVLAETIAALRRPAREARSAAA